ncbi:MAG: class I SAM-dependent methyltransferase [Anaerolineales bacterium]|nr:class I SAM-dependent methyltransferase [Anaerolineales bacterium]
MSLSKRIFFYLSYFQNPPWDTGITPPEVWEFIRQHPPGRALDLGCGTGTNAITLAQHGWQVSGVDFVGRAIRLARRKAKRAGVRVDFHQGDVSRLSEVLRRQQIQGPFKLVLDIGCFHSLSLEGKTAYAAALEGLLAPQGVFLIYTFLSAPPDALSGLQPSDLELLERHLRLVQRVDGSERGRRPSAWLTYQRREAGSP